MSLNDRDRKILWTKAGNRCSYSFNGEVCDSLLVQKENGTETIIGDECHIVGPKEGSPRYVPNFPSLDSEFNRILLCKLHHKIIDDNENIYTSEVLRDMKKRHEEKINQTQQSLSIRDSEFLVAVKNANRATAMEINRDAEVFNVKATLKAENVREAVGFSTNRGLTIASPKQCPSCGAFLPRLFVGSPPFKVTCPSCGRESEP